MNFDVVKETVYYAKEQAAKRGKKFLFTLTTNGLLLKDDVAQFLNEEMENVVLSLDGRREVHDAVRKTANGKGSFDFVIENIKNFVKIRGDKSYYVRGTFTARNLDFGKDVLFLADKRTVFGGQRVRQHLHGTRRHRHSRSGDHQGHAPRSLRRVRPPVRRLLKARGGGEGLQLLPYFFHFNVDLEGGPCLAKRVSACGAGNEYFSVVPNGDIYPCHQFAGDSAFKMGNVFEGRLDEEIRGKFKNSCLFTRQKCDSCFAKFICSGGCNANNYHYNGDINIPYEMTCEMMKKRTENAMHILAERKRRKGQI